MRSAHAHRRLVARRQALGAGFDDDEARGAVEHDADDEQFGGIGARHERLLAGDDEVGAVPGGRRRGGARVGERARFGERERGDGGLLLVGEGGQVGLLLRGRAVARDGGRDGGRCHDRNGEAHVAAGELLENEGRHHGAALLGDAAELGRDADERQAHLGGLRTDLVGQGALRVGLRRGGTQQFVGQFGGDGGDRLLILGGRQVELAARLRRGGACRVARAGLLGEGAPGHRLSLETGLAALVEGTLDLGADRRVLEQIVPAGLGEKAQCDGLALVGEGGLVGGRSHLGPFRE